MPDGQIFNVQRFSVHDGPGIRTTVFLKGCPLRCAWCHNPEGISTAPEMMVLVDRCIHCGQCADACPSGFLAGGTAPCTLCGTCTEICPVEARQVIGRAVTVDELLAEVLKDRIFFDDSGGGVTFSGGEPLAQPRFLCAALTACRRAGLHTVVDTCGFCRRDDLRAVARLTDVFLFDLKIMDERKHRELTGVSNRPILDNLRALAHDHPDVRIRVPVIPGVNDSRANMAATARFASALPGVRRVSLLPYHATGEPKRERLGLVRQLRGVAAPPQGRLEELAGELSAAGLETHFGG